MQRLRDDFLAGAVLSGDQNIGVGRSDAGDRFQHGLHGRRVGNEFGPALGAEQSILRLQAFGLLQSATQFDLGAKDRQQPLIVPGLLNEVARAAAHGLDGEFHIAPGGHHDHRNAAVERDDFGQQIEAFVAGSCVARVVQVDQERIVGVSVSTAPRRASAGERTVSTW